MESENLASRPCLFLVKLKLCLHPFTPTLPPIKWKTIFPTSERVKSTQTHVLDAPTGTEVRMEKGSIGRNRRIRGMAMERETRRKCRTGQAVF